MLDDGQGYPKIMSKDLIFKENLKMGTLGENQAFEFLKTHNHYIEDNRRQKYDNGGPKLIGALGSIVLPDFTVYNVDGPCYALDVKVKSRPYLIDGKYYFTVDYKYNDYIKATKIKKLDFLALMFIYKGMMFLYKDSDLAGTHVFDNEFSKGPVYLFEYDKTKVVGSP